MTTLAVAGRWGRHLKSSLTGSAQHHREQEGKEVLLHKAVIAGYRSKMVDAEDDTRDCRRFVEQRRFPRWKQVEQKAGEL